MSGTNTSSRRRRAARRGKFGLSRLSKSTSPGGRASPRLRAAARRGPRRGRGEHSSARRAAFAAARRAGNTTPAARLRTTPRSAQRAFPSSTSNDAACLSARGGSVPNARFDRTPRVLRDLRARPAGSCTKRCHRLPRAHVLTSRRGCARPQTRHAVRSWLRFRLQDDAIDARNLIAGHRWSPFGHSVSAPKRRTRRGKRPQSCQSTRVGTLESRFTTRGRVCRPRRRSASERGTSARETVFATRVAKRVRLAAEADDLRDAPRGEALRKRPLGARRRGGWNAENELYSCGDDKDRAMERQRRRGREGTPTRSVWSRASAVVQPLDPDPPAPDLTRGRGVSQSRRLQRSRTTSVGPSPRELEARALAARRATTPSPPARADPTRADPLLLAFPDPARASVRPALLGCAIWTRSSRRCSPPPPTGRRARRRRARSRRRAPTAPCAFLRNGRVERTVEAHAGAVTSVRWTDGACAPPPARTAR